MNGPKLLLRIVLVVACATVWAATGQQAQRHALTHDEHPESDTPLKAEPGDSSSGAPTCDFMDTDGDTDIDLEDFAAFQACFGETSTTQVAYSCFRGIAEYRWDPEECGADPDRDEISYRWTAPSDVTSVLVELWGAGGGGGLGADSLGGCTPGGGGGGGGGCGGYVRAVVPVVPGRAYTIRVGNGGDPGQPGDGWPAGANGADTTFERSTGDVLARAEGGRGGEGTHGVAQSGCSGGPGGAGELPGAGVTGIIRAGCPGGPGKDGYPPTEIELPDGEIVCSTGMGGGPGVGTSPMFSELFPWADYCRDFGPPCPPIYGESCCYFGMGETGGPRPPEFPVTPATRGYPGYAILNW